MPTNIVPMWGQQHPPGCQCGCGGSWGCDSPGWGQDLLQCWDQINQLKCIIKQIMDEVGGPIRFGPIRGVVDGSDAKPGQVGEYVQFNQSVDLPAGNSMPTVSMGVLQPGDWNVWMTMAPNTTVAWVAFFLNPTPTGFTDNLTVYFANGTEQSTLISSTARALISVPTLIAVQIECSNTGAAVTGGLTFMARRMR